MTSKSSVTGLSAGQRTMLRAGLKKLQILEESFVSFGLGQTSESSWLSARTQASQGMSSSS